MFNRERVALFAVLAIVLAACGAPVQNLELPPTRTFPTAVPFPTKTPATAAQSAQGGQTASNGVTEVAIQPSVTPTSLPPTAAPTEIPLTATPTARVFATATRFVTPVPGDPARGKVWFNAGIGVASVPVCATCHNVVDDGTVKVGPLMAGIANRAGVGERGPDAWTYIHASIVNPNAYMVPNEGSHIYQAGGQSLMYQNYAKDLSEDQINDLVAYLLTVKN